eukprot:1705612-Pyramimonas_sp.AAC.1
MQPGVGHPRIRLGGQDAQMFGRALPSTYCSSPGPVINNNLAISRHRSEQEISLYRCHGGRACPSHQTKQLPWLN